MELVSGAPTGASESQSVAPPIPPASVTVTPVPPATLVALGESEGGTPIVIVSEPDVPPPGDGVRTATCAVPSDRMSAAPIVARIWVVLAKVVARLAPFHRTTDEGTNELPVTVRVKLPAPANVRLGES